MTSAPADWCSKGSAKRCYINEGWGSWVVPNYSSSVFMTGTLWWRVYGHVHTQAALTNTTLPAFKLA